MTFPSSARHDAAAAMRRLTHAFVAHEANDELMESLACAAGSFHDELVRGARRNRAAGLSVEHVFVNEPSTDEPTGPMGAALADRAVGGSANPSAIEIDARIVDDEVIATFVLGPACEGAPGRAHGGVVAAVFDDVTGYVLRIAGAPAFTGTLSITYRAPTPIERPLEIRSRLVGRDKRKLFIGAECRADDLLIATAEAVYIVVDAARFRPNPAASDINAHVELQPSPEVS